jgi:general secretion pathway protein J
LTIRNLKLKSAKHNSQFSILTSHSPGFTLFEILIAIFIFGIVMTTIFGSFIAVFSNTDAIFDGINDYDMAKNCLNRMITDLQTVHISPGEIYMRPEFDDPPDPYRIVGDTGYAGNGSFSRLRFTSRSHLPLENNMQKGIAEIVYYVRNRGDNENILTRADSLFPYKRFEGKAFEENPGDPILCEKVRSLAFKYYDEEGTEYDHWDSESEEFKYATPRAVSIKLEFGDDSSSLLFETMVHLPVYREKTG